MNTLKIFSNTVENVDEEQETNEVVEDNNIQTITKPPTPPNKFFFLDIEETETDYTTDWDFSEENSPTNFIRPQKIYTVNELPQPHFALAWGLLILK